MNHPNDGGPASPGVGLGVDSWSAGMSLRDYLAAAALTGRLAAERNSTQEDGFAGYAELAEEAYGLADAMMVERKKGAAS